MTTELAPVTNVMHDQPALRPEVEHQRQLVKTAQYLSQLGRNATTKFAIQSSRDNFSVQEVQIVLSARDARAAELKPAKVIPEDYPEPASQLAPEPDTWTPTQCLENMPQGQQRELDWRERQYKD